MDNIQVEQEDADNTGDHSSVLASILNTKQFGKQRKLKIIKDKDTCKITFCEIKIDNAKLWELNNELNETMSDTVNQPDLLKTTKPDSEVSASKKISSISSFSI